MLWYISRLVVGGDSRLVGDLSTIPVTRWVARLREVSIHNEWQILVIEGNVSNVPICHHILPQTGLSAILPNLEHAGTTWVAIF